MKGEEDDSRLEGGGVESVRAVPALFLFHRLHDGSPRTGLDYSLPGGDDGNGAVQHSTLCAAQPPRAAYRGGWESAWRRPGGVRACHVFRIFRKGGVPLVATKTQHLETTVLPQLHPDLSHHRFSMIPCEMCYNRDRLLVFAVAQSIGSILNFTAM